MLSAALRLSRSAAVERICAGNVQVNHRDTERTDLLLQAGDLLSIRGFGRVRVRAIGTPNRKKRLPLTLEIFGKP